MDRNQRRAILKEGMPQFIGSTVWYRHRLNLSVTYTEGAHFVAEKGEAFWLLDEIALANAYNRKVGREEFQVWTLKVTGTTAKLVCDDGNDIVVFTKNILFTDFPLDEIKLYCEYNVIMLPSER